MLGLFIHAPNENGGGAPSTSPGIQPVYFIREEDPTAWGDGQSGPGSTPPPWSMGWLAELMASNLGAWLAWLVQPYSPVTYIHSCPLLT